MHDGRERRSERRRSVFLRARVCGLVDGQEMDCDIQDASRAGCKIISEDIDRIPEMVSLTIRGLGETFAGRVIWRKDNMAGVQFIGGNGDAALRAPASAVGDG